MDSKRTMWHGHSCLSVLVALSLLMTACVSEQRAGRDAASMPAVTQVMKRQITNAVDAGDGDYVVRALREKLVADPDNLTVRLQLAEHYQQIGYPELAIEHYRLTASHFPASAAVAMRLAKSLREFDHAEEAVQSLVTFCKKNAAPPPELLSLLGILEDEAGQFSEAEKVYRAALENAPRLGYLHNNLGYNLLLQGRAKEAVDQFREALAIEPHSRLANDNLGLALLAQWKTDEQPKEALLRWESVSGPATAHNNLATVLMEQGRFADARKELEVALSYQKDHAAAHANLQLLAELDGKPAVATNDAGRNARSTSFWRRVGNVLSGKNKGEGTPADESASMKK
jgi:Flp pilus assembly protein TadD